MNKNIYAVYENSNVDKTNKYQTVIEQQIPLPQSIMIASENFPISGDVEIGQQVIPTDK